MSQHPNQTHNQTQQPDPAQASAATPDIPPNHTDLFDYQNMEWELDEPPNTLDYPKDQLFHLYAISGHLFIGHWSPNYQMAAQAPTNHMHIVGWSPLLNEVGTVQ